MYQIDPSKSTTFPFDFFKLKKKHLTFIDESQFKRVPLDYFVFFYYVNMSSIFFSKQMA